MPHFSNPGGKGRLARPFVSLGSGGKPSSCTAMEAGSALLSAAEAVAAEAAEAAAEAAEAAAEAAEEARAAEAREAFLKTPELSALLSALLSI